MMKKTRKIWRGLLCLCMAIWLVPATVQALTIDITGTITGTATYDGVNVTIRQTGVIISGTFRDNTVFSKEGALILGGTFVNSKIEDDGTGRYGLKVNLDNLSTDSILSEYENVQYAIMPYNTEFSFTLSPDAGYGLPSSIAISQGDTALASGTDYTYNNSTGAVTINANVIKAPLVLEASGASHTHTWSDTWSSDAAHHWHECGNRSCPITDNSLKDGYGEHVCDQKTVDETYKASAATCTTAAVYYKSCVCGRAGTETFSSGEPDSSRHTALSKTEAKEATCTENGHTQYWYCDACGKYFSDENGSKEIALADTMISMTGHGFGADWKSDSANHWHECACGEKTDITAHTYGSWTITRGAAATETGSQEKACSVCGRKVTESIPATGTKSAGSADTPQTGDPNSTGVFIALFLLAGAGLTGMGIYAKKHRVQ
ncbi:hypothetical protein LQE92_01835 [Lacrimispora sp. NSJ-141]|uniref:Gram-positive cocci surface proteins LPxTG domain-containing protein n=1 Tax=Lientehia hominis TaxID=2897778 RepID=A0AAP2W922_9FIRM|nr:hypothetical protein [Lientehia hominis]MCD2491367.1 hypothetical protein [Lientehia hominis]